jgi:hypothetical protein
MTWNTIATVWLLLSAAGTVIITVGIAVWVLRHYNQDIQERESVQQLEPDQNPHPPSSDSQQDTPYHEPSSR